MPDLRALIGYWGYPAIALVVLLGNLGLPVPEETILGLAGYLVWRGELRLPLVLAAGIGSAVAGDNIGYFLGRRYGQEALARYGHWVRLTPARLGAVRRAVTRYGSLAIFTARFLAGLRFLAGPVAGATGLRFVPFLTANLVGALLYVPLVVGAGYAVGYGFGARLERLRQTVGALEHLVLLAAFFATLLLLGRRVWRARRAGRVG